MHSLVAYLLFLYVIRQKIFAMVLHLKVTDKIIPTNIALIFRTFNLFEIKDVGTTLGTDAYYKTIGYAGALIDQTGKKDQYICEGLLNLCGTSFDEIIERTKKDDASYYQPKIDRLSQDNEHLSSENNYLKLLLKQNNIPFHILHLLSLCFLFLSIINFVSPYTFCN